MARRTRRAKKENGDADAGTATSESEHTRITKAGEEGLNRPEGDPPDLIEYEDGEYEQHETKEVFFLKIVEDDPKGLTHHLKNRVHYYELNEADFRRLFDVAETEDDD